MAGRSAIRWKQFQLQYQHILNSRRFLTRDNSDWLPAHHFGDLVLAKRFSLYRSSLVLNAGVGNLWNADFQNVAWRPMPGRNYYLRLEWEFLNR